MNGFSAGRLLRFPRPYAPYGGLLAGMLVVTVVGMQVSTSLAARQPDFKMFEGDTARLWLPERQAADYGAEDAERRRTLERGVLDLKIVQEAIKEREQIEERRSAITTGAVTADGQGVGARAEGARFVGSTEAQAILDAVTRIGRGEASVIVAARSGTQAATAAISWSGNSITKPNQLPSVAGDEVQAFGSLPTPTPASGGLGLEGGPNRPEPAGAPSPAPTEQPPLVGPAPASGPVTPPAPAPTQPPAPAPVAPTSAPPPTTTGTPAPPFVPNPPAPTAAPTTVVSGPFSPGSPNAPTQPRPVQAQPTFGPSVPAPGPAIPPPPFVPPATPAPGATRPPAPTNTPVPNPPTSTPAPTDTAAPGAPTNTPPPTFTPPPTNTPVPTNTPAPTNPPGPAPTSTPLPDTFESNDSCGVATLLSMNVGYQSYLSRPGDIDYYRVAVNEVPWDITVRLNAPSSGYDVYLFRDCFSEASQLGNASGVGSSRSITYRALQTGNYYVVVLSRTGTFGASPYTLAVEGTRPPATPIPTQSPAPTQTPVPTSTATPAGPTATPTPLPVVITTQFATGAIIEFKNAGPGQSSTAFANVSNGSNVPFTYALINEPQPDGGSANSIAWTDIVNGFQLDIWRENDGAVLYRGPLNMTAQSQQPVPLGRLDPGASQKLNFRVSLPATADNRFQNQSVTVIFIWSAQQVP